MPAAPLLHLPKFALSILKEASRHILKHPVVGIAAAARTPDGRWVLIRRTDTGGWAMPGGTVEWGETLTETLRRELLEETGIEEVRLDQVTGVYSAPARDPRFHAVTIVVRATVALPSRQPKNPLEISEVRCFRENETPAELSMRMTDMFRNAQKGIATGLE